MATAEQKGKKPRIDDEEGERIDGALLRSIEKLQEIQDEVERVNEEASDKVLEVEQKYDEIRRPIYARRNEIIKQIPDFWLTAFLSHPGDLLTEDDQKIFKHLVSIDVDELKDGYSITLTFSSNPYFEDTKLTKTYSFSDDGTMTVKATSINWKDGMDIANGKAYTKNGEKRLLIDESFFTWFNDAKNKRFAQGEMDQVADIIKEDLWPNPLKFFNNEAEDEFEGEEDEEVVEHPGTVELAGLRFGEEPAVAETAIGQLAVSKGRQGREAQNIVRLYLANIRLKNAATDVVITAYEPLLINPLSESSQAVAAGPAVPAEQAGCLAMSEVFRLAVMNFNIHDWNLFNGGT